MRDQQTPSVGDQQYERTEPFAGRFVTRRQREVLDAIEIYWRKNQVPPSHRSLKAELGISSKQGVHEFIKKLKGRQLVVAATNKARTLKTCRMRVGMGQSQSGPGMVIMWGK